MSASFPMPLRRRIARGAVLLGLLSLLAACAMQAPATPEEAVRARAQARWNALLAGDLQQAYQFLSPASRALISFQVFRARFGSTVTWKSAEVFKVVCEQPDHCLATVKVTYRPLLPRGSIKDIETGVDEVWLLESGQWWLPQKL
ncbi:MAG: hypothetical protein QM750_08445 [Rubrivivax sp.]